MVGFSFPVCNDLKKIPQLWVDPISDSEAYLLYEKPFAEGWWEKCIFNLLLKRIHVFMPFSPS